MCRSQTPCYTNNTEDTFVKIFLRADRRYRNLSNWFIIFKFNVRIAQWFQKWAVPPPWGEVGLPRWALIGMRGERERCYYHRGALVDK
jgi:hypothetical protein